MLIEFRVKNYRSIGEEQVFSFVAGPEKKSGKGDKPHDGRVVDCPPPVGLRLLKSCVIYGANAAGKSNLLRALSTFRHLIVHSSDHKPGDLIKGAEPFAFDNDHKNAPVEFEMTFIMEGVRYQYGFNFNKKHICEEWLLTYPKGRAASLFERHTNEEGVAGTMVDFGPSMKGEKQSNARNLRSNVLLISKGAQEGNPILEKLYLWFRRKLNIESLPLRNERLISRTTHMILNDESKKNQITKIIRSADFGILELQPYKESLLESQMFRDMPDNMKQDLPPEMLSEAFVLDVNMLHKGISGSPILLDLDDESNGTRRFFGLSGLLIEVLDEGGVLVVDELDASLHPLLVRRIVEMFHDPDINKKNAQLLFATHDTTLLSPKLFRRDQVWFVEKDGRGQSQYYSLFDYKLEGKGKARKNEAWERGYLQGRYGAVPFLGEFSF